MGRHNETELDRIARHEAPLVPEDQEDRYQVLLRSSPDVIVIVDSDRIMRTVNPAFTRLFGYQEEEVLGKSVEMLHTSPEAFESYGRRVYPVVSREGSWRGEWEYRTKDGALLPMEAVLSRLGGEGSGEFLAILRDITERKKLQEAAERRIAALTLPLEEEPEVTLLDLFDLAEIQRLQDEFAAATGVASVITNTDGSPITEPSNFCRLCSEVIRGTGKGRANCYKSDAFLGRHNPEGPTIQPCLSGGLWDAGAAIEVGGSHIANWLIGQVRDETQSEEQLRRYAREIGADEDQAARAFAEVPAMSRQQFQSVAQVLHTLARQLSLLAYQNTQQARFIAERQRAEEALRKRERQYRLLADNTGDVIWVRDMDMNLTYVSQAVLKARGYTPEEAMAQSLDEVLTPESARLSVETFVSISTQLAQGVESFEPVVLDLEHRCKDGGTVWMECKMSPLYDDGRLMGILGVSRDITDRKAAEQIRLSNRRRLEQAHQLARLGHWDWNRQNNQLAWSDEVYEIFGRDKDAFELTEESFESCIHEDDRDSFLAQREAALAQSGHIDVEHRITWPDGTVRHVHELAEMIKGEEGTVVQVSGTVQDITERKEAERELAQREAILRSTFRAAPIGIGTVKGADRVVGWSNHRLQQMTGYSAGELEGMPAKMLYESEDEYLRVGRVKHAEVRKAGVGSVETSWRRKDGSVFPLLLSSAEVELGNFEAGLVFTALDMTDLRRAEQERATMAGQLAQAQKMDALGTLSSGIAHDFNNILAAIMGYSELALDEIPEDQPVRQDIAEITQAATKAKRLVRQILTFSRSVEGQKRPLSINRAIEESSKILTRTLPKMINLEFDLSEDIRPVQADPQQMEQMLINMATNAADAMDGGGNITVATRNIGLERHVCEKCGDVLSGCHVLVSVKDDGVGMSPEVRERIFEPFFTTKGVGKGTGLGLSTVYGIITGHNGHICCQSREGRGTEFLIYLPVVEGEISPGGEPVDAAKTGPQGSGTVLVVDDEPYVRDIAQKMLTRSGYQVMQARSGEEALEIYGRKGESIKLVLMDLGMPGMGGKACLAEIRRLDPQARVLIASGYIQYELTDELQSLGAAGMVSKPYRKQDILEAMQEALA